jgi:hypothetical protein
MINPAKVPDHIRGEIIANKGWPEATAEEDFKRYCKSADPKDLFDSYCEWNGLINWGKTLYDVVHSLDDAKVSELTQTKGAPKKPLMSNGRPF